MIQQAQRHGRQNPQSNGAALLVGLFIAVSALAYLFPLNGDDWAWGSRIGIDRLHSGFADYNGRYAGNLLVLTLTRLTWLAPLAIGAATVGIVWLVAAVAHIRGRLGYALLSVLVLTMPQGLWRETIAWVSGFSNYVPAALVALLFIRSMQRDWRGDGVARVPSLVRYPVIVVLGVVGQLFIENVTIYLVLAAATYVAAVAVKRRQLTRVGITWLAAFIAGAAIMYSNSAYSRVAQDRPGYQSVKISLTPAGIKKLVVRAADPISGFAITANTVLNIVLAALLCVVVARSAARAGRGWRISAYAATTVFLGIALVLPYLGTLQRLPTSVRALNGVSAAALAVALLLVAAKFLTDDGRRLALVGYMLSIVVLSGPFLVANPIGPRCFFVTFVFLLLVVGVLVAELLATTRHAPAKVLAPALTVFAAGVLAVYFAIYGAITHAAHLRLEEVRRDVARGDTTSTVRDLPFRGWVHVPDPTPGVWEDRYKIFYDIPADVTIDLRRAKGKVS